MEENGNVKSNSLLMDIIFIEDEKTNKFKSKYEIFNKMNCSVTYSTQKTRYSTKRRSKFYL